MAELPVLDCIETEIYTDYRCTDRQLISWEGNYLPPDTWDMVWLLLCIKLDLKFEQNLLDSGDVGCAR